MTSQSVSKAIESVLDIARWAPSGDNAQPWRFRFKADREIEILIRRKNSNVYEYRNGEPTLISAGALIENMVIAAPAFGLEAKWRYVDSAGGLDRVVVSFSDNSALFEGNLYHEIKRRSVDRRAFKVRALTSEQKRQLSDALNPDMQLQWYSSLSERRMIARLSALATDIRLTIPETFQVHADIVDWENTNSEHGIPSRALGLDPLTLLLTRWSMANWKRTKLMNAFGAPRFASLQMDLLPGLLSASYFAIRRAGVPRDIGSFVSKTIESGQAIQRLWLTATKLGLAIQPCVAILAFWTHAECNQGFTVNQRAKKKARTLSSLGNRMFGPSADILFLGRIGWPRTVSVSRSIRLPLADLFEPRDCQQVPSVQIKLE